MKRSVLLLVILFLGFNSWSQLLKIELGVNGLTCSQCSRSVYKKLSQLDFIKNIDMDLNTHSTVITMKNSQNYDIDQVAQAVIDAGYSVRNMVLFFENTGLEIHDSHFENAKQKFYFSPIDLQKIRSAFTAEVIGKKYNSDRKMNRLLPDGFINQLNKTYFVVIK